MGVILFYFLFLKFSDVLREVLRARLDKTAQTC